MQLKEYICYASPFLPTCEYNAISRSLKLCVGKEIGGSEVGGAR